MHGDYTLSFGKHKGKPLREVPVNYLDWLIGQEWLDSRLKRIITEHLETERKGEWESLGEG
jgi:uncharacterized protein (DUF3820 family)